MNGRVLIEGADGMCICGFANLFPLSFLADRNRSENVRNKSANSTLDPDSGTKTLAFDNEYS